MTKAPTHARFTLEFKQDAVRLWCCRAPDDAIDWKIKWSGVAAAAVEIRLSVMIAKKLGVTRAASSAAPTPGMSRERLLEQLKELLK